MRTLMQGTLFAIATLMAMGAHAEFVRAKGRVMFVDGDGEKKPFARVQVRLMDSDSDYDEEIARGFTDAQGHYDLSGSAGDSPCVGCGTPDPYVKAVLKDPGRIEVHDIMHFTRNAVLTPTREETAGTIDFGERTFTTAYPEGEAAILYARAQRTYAAFKELSGDAKVPGNDGEVAIEIPVVLSGGSPYTTWDTIHWPGVYKAWGTFDHEFGHRIRHAADGNVGHFNNDLVWYRYGRHHHDDEDTNLGFAFNEGWADYFRDQLQPDSITGAWNGINVGDEVEGHVGHKLVDLSAACGGFKPMWKALKANPRKLHSFPEFKQAFMDRKPTCLLDLDVSQPKPKPESIDIAHDADAQVLFEQQAGMKKYLDGMDVRARTMPVRKLERIPSSIRTQDHALVTRLATRRMQSAQRWEADSRVTYRKLHENLPAMTPQTIRDGSYERAAQTARRAFLIRIAQPRLREVQALRREIAAERRKATGVPLRSYLDQLDGKYARLERHLSKALVASDAGRITVPLEILPKSFSGQASGDR